MTDEISSYQEKLERVGAFQTQIEDFEQVIDRHWIDPPEIELQSKYLEYAENLRTVEDEVERKSTLKGYVETQVAEKLQGWMNAVQPLRDMRERVSDFQRRLDSEQSDIDALITSHRARESDAKESLARMKEDEMRKRAAFNSLKNPSGFERARIWIFVLAVVVLGLGTAYYYINVQGQIIVAQNGGPANYFDSGTDRFSLSEFISQSPTNLFYGVGAIIFFLIGKVVGSVYERLEHPSWLMITVSVLCVGVVAATAFLVASATTQSLELATAEQTARAARDAIEALSFNLGTAVNCAEPVFASETACVESIAADARLEEMRAATGGMTFWVTASVLFSEILLGSITWIIVADYDKKHASNGGDLEKELAGMAVSLGDQMSLRDELAKETRLLQQVTAEIDSLKARVSGMMSKVPSGDAIARRHQTILKREETLAIAEYHRAKTNWPA